MRRYCRNLCAFRLELTGSSAHDFVVSNCRYMKKQWRFCKIAPGGASAFYSILYIGRRVQKLLVEYILHGGIYTDTNTGRAVEFSLDETTLNINSLQSIFADLISISNNTYDTTPSMAHDYVVTKITTNSAPHTSRTITAIASMFGMVL